MLDSPNWKLTADGYVDGYHIGYLHSSTIGEKSITNRNTYDFFGPHVRIGFANKPINEIRDRPEDEWPPMFEVMSMVHYVFPNMSISGQPERPLMVSRLLPGPTPDRSRTQQYHYYRQPVEGEEAIATGRDPADALRPGDGRGGLRHRVQDQRGLAAIADGHFRFGRNEGGNQNLHRWIDDLVDNGRARPALT